MNEKQGTPHLSIGDVVDGRYELLEEIGEGGFATVYRARQRIIDRPIALKVLHVIPNPRKAQAFAERFAYEARIAAQIHHPNVVMIHDFGFAGVMQQPYIAMELLQGHGLDEELRRFGALEPARAMRLFRQALDALRVGHRTGVVHKDLKPANLFLTWPEPDAPEVVKILDFGVARLASEATSHTATGEVIGTPQYLAPEYILEQLVTPAFDVYQMGLILAEMLSGQKVVTGVNPYSCAMKHADGDLDVPDALWHSALGPLLRRALERDHRRRFAHAGELLEAFDRIDVREVVEGLTRGRGGMPLRGVRGVDEPHSSTAPLRADEPWLDHLAERAVAQRGRHDAAEVRPTEVLPTLESQQLAEPGAPVPTAVHDSAEVVRLLERSRTGLEGGQAAPAGRVPGAPPWADPALFAAHVASARREQQSASNPQRSFDVASAVARGASSFAERTRGAAPTSAPLRLDAEDVRRSFEAARREVSGRVESGVGLRPLPPDHPAARGQQPQPRHLVELADDDEPPTDDVAAVPAEREIHGTVVPALHHAETRVATAADVARRAPSEPEVDIARLAAARAAAVDDEDEVDRPTLLHVGSTADLNALRRQYHTQVTDGERAGSSASLVVWVVVAVVAVAVAASLVAMLVM